MNEHATESAAVLEFRAMRYVPGAWAAGNVPGADCAGWRIQPGSFHLVLNPKGSGQAWADLAAGLVTPGEGTVWFAGRDWARCAPLEAARQRTRIGRVFDGPAWLSNLDVDENITLRERHVTRRPEADIEAEARRWARQFGLEDLPRIRPAHARRDDLRRAQWIRALLGQPVLLLLEQPTDDAPAAEAAAFAAAVATARGGGAAIIWFTAEEQVWQHMPVADVRRYRLAGTSLKPEPDHRSQRE